MSEYDGDIQLSVSLKPGNIKASAQKLAQSVKKIFDENAGEKMDKSLKRVLTSMDKVNGKAVSIQAEMKKLEGVKISTKEYQSLENTLDVVSTKMGKIRHEMIEFEKENNTASSKYARLQKEFVKLETLEHGVMQKMSGLEFSGRDYILGEATDKYAKLSDELSELNNQQRINISRYDELRNKSSSTVPVMKSLVSKMQDFGSTLVNIGKTGEKFLSPITNKIKSLASHFRNAKKEANGLDFSIGKLFKKILMYGFGIRSLYILFRRLRSTIKEGIDKLVQFNNGANETNRSMSALSSAFATFKNSIGAAVAPLVNALAPALTRIIELATSAVNAIGQLIAALTGRSTFIKAKKVTNDYAASLDKTAGSAKKAKNELEQLAGFDELNVLNKPKEDSGSGGGGGGGVGDLFEEVPIDSKIKSIADKIKEMLKQLVAPIKKAWEDTKDFVINSWKQAINSMKELAKTVWDDFIEVWNQEATVEMFRDIFRIVGDIGLIISAIADDIKEAWEYNNNGKRALEAIRDILATVVRNIREAADYTVQWARELDLKPLFSSLTEYLISLKPIAEAVTGTLKDFYENVLLKLAKWTLEKGLPELLQVFKDFNNSIDWDSLRQRLSEFWTHLEPFGETVGEGLIIFIRDCSSALSKFINSGSFESFLTKIEDWMDSVEPEDVARGLKAIAAAILMFKFSQFVGNGIIAFTRFVEFLILVKPYLMTIARGIRFIGEAIKFIAEIPVLGLGLVITGVTELAYVLQGLMETLRGGNGQVTQLGTELHGLGDELKYTGDISQGQWDALWRSVEEWESAGKSSSEIIKLFTDRLDGLGVSTEDASAAIEGLRGSNMLTDETYESLINNVQNLSSKAEIQSKKVKDNVESYDELRNKLTQTEAAMGLTEYQVGVLNTSLAESESQGKSTDEAYQELIKTTDLCGVSSTEFADIMNVDVVNANENAQGAINDTEQATVNLQDTTDTATSQIQSDFSTTKDSVNSDMDDMSSHWSSTWDSMTAAVKDAINSMIDSINGFSIDIPSEIPVIGGIHWSPKIPHLAQGAVIPPNKEFMAVLGDQTSGTNIETPLDTMIEAFNAAKGDEEALLREQNDILRQLLYKEWRLDPKDVFNATRAQNQDFIRRTGKSAFAY